MREENGKIDGDLIVCDPVTIHGMVTGKIVVRDGGLLTLHGICSKNLEVEAGGIARTTGIVGGNIINHGGEISIQGIVKGAIACPNGTTEIDSRAIVCGGIEGTVILTCKSCSQKLRLTAKQHNLTVTCPNCKSSWQWTAGQQKERDNNEQKIPQEVVDGVFNNFDNIFDEFFKNARFHSPQPQPTRSFQRIVIQIENFTGKAAAISILLSISLFVVVLMLKGFNLSLLFVDSTVTRTCATLFCGGIVLLVTTALLQTIRD